MAQEIQSIVDSVIDMLTIWIAFAALFALGPNEEELRVRNEPRDKARP
jgi:hypothetical protein